jgi:hypothetical protein
MLERWNDFVLTKEIMYKQTNVIVAIITHFLSEEKYFPFFLGNFFVGKMLWLGDYFSLHVWSIFIFSITNLVLSPQAS